MPGRRKHGRPKSVFGNNRRLPGSEAICDGRDLSGTPQLQRHALRRIVPPRLRCNPCKSQHAQCAWPALLRSSARNSTSRRSRSPYDLAGKYRQGRCRLCRSRHTSGLDVPRGRDRRRQPESSRILPRARNSSGAWTMSLHVSAWRRNCPSPARLHSPDHWSLSAPHSGLEWEMALMTDDGPREARHPPNQSNSRVSENTSD
jgi:hypothetical protein